MGQACLFDPHAALRKLRVKVCVSPSGELTAMFPRSAGHSEQSIAEARRIVREHAAVLRLQMARKGEPIMKLYAKGLVRADRGRPVVAGKMPRS